MEIIQIAGTSFHVEATLGAAGPPIVFINSLGTDFRIWDGVVAQLGGQWGTLRYDKRGHGLSDEGDAPNLIAAHARDLIAILAAKGIKRAVFCGVSIGGMIALGVWGQRPDLVAGLILCDTAHRIGTPEFWGNRIAAINQDGLDGIADGVMQRWFAPSFHRDHADWVRVYRNMMTRTPQAGYVAACLAIRDADLTDIAASVTVPTMCVVGSEDGATPPDLVRSLSQLIPHSRFHVLDDAGHLPCVEKPEHIASLIQAFATEVSHV